MFVKVSNKLFYGFDISGKGIYKTINNDKVLLIMYYFYINTNRENICIFSIEDIALYFGYKPKAGKGKINDQIIDVLLKLHESKVINLSEKDIKPKQLYRCQLLIDLKNNFFSLFDSEVKKILETKLDEIDNVKLLVYYCYLKSRMFTRSNDVDIVRSGGKAESCYPSYKNIYDDIGLTDKIIIKYNKSLEKLNLIRIGNAGLYYFKEDSKKRVYESNNTYVLYKEGWQDELKLSIKTYKELFTDRIFIDNRKYKNNNRSDNGYIARVSYLNNQGKATEEQIQRMNQLLETKALIDNTDNVKFQILALFRDKEYSGMLLSEIYENKNESDLSDKYRDIEDKLGLVDDNGELLVGYDYYTWVMVNYIPEEEQKFINFIAKKKNEFLAKEVIDIIYEQDLVYLSDNEPYWGNQYTFSEAKEDDDWDTDLNNDPMVV